MGEASFNQRVLPATVEQRLRAIAQYHERSRRARLIAF
jgi:hypothetical protein